MNLVQLDQQGNNVKFLFSKHNLSLRLVYFIIIFFIKHQHYQHAIEYFKPNINQ